MSEKKTFADECLAIANAATPGPWYWRPTSDTRFVSDKYFQNIRLTSKTEDRVFMADSGLNSDAEFISESRTMVPELAKRLKKACAWLRTNCGKYGDEYLNQIADELEKPLEDGKE